MTAITTAKINWQTDDNGIRIPTSSEFGDVYFSKTDGLAESRYVFIDGNDLSNRLANLAGFERFVIGEIGFGTGLNVLAIWQLWRHVRPNNHSHLHIITTEKFPLTKNDLEQALSVWTELTPFAKKLIDNYPPPLAGCHRLNFFDERITIDLWLGDATNSLSQVIGNAKVNAWLLDGFAPACNGELWADSLFKQIARLSNEQTTLATFSVASPVKTGLKTHGFTLAKRKGFGKKREMLTAKFDLSDLDSNLDNGRIQYAPTLIVGNFSQLKFKPLKPTKLIHYKKTGSHFAKPPFSLAFARKKIIAFAHVRPTAKKSTTQFHLPTLPKTTQPMQIAVIGAGVAGLSCAYALAVRGHSVTVFDKDKPLSGASGNVRAVIAPKLTSLKRLETNLHAIGYLASLRYYPAISDFIGRTQYAPTKKNLPIFEKTGVLDLLSHNRLELDEVQGFPSEFASLLMREQAEKLAGADVGQAIFLPHAGLIDTAHFVQAVLSHPNIRFLTGKLENFTQIGDKVEIQLDSFNQPFDHLILCTAQATCDFLPQIKAFNFSRGQVSWFEIKNEENLPKLPLKYGGYFAKFEQQGKQNVMLGASFVRDTLDTTPTLQEHHSNLAEFETAIGIKINTPPLVDWHGRAGIRSQTVDYLPLVGQVDDSESRIWTFSALGSKGYCYAPVCSELLAGLICGEILPLSETMVKKLSSNRKVLQR